LSFDVSGSEGTDIIFISGGGKGGFSGDNGGDGGDGGGARLYDDTELRSTSISDISS
tara:strand:+ start:252 stop:422 length:171 start_codon:yes stop_codon:yes gene_type:complete